MRKGVTSAAGYVRPHANLQRMLAQTVKLARSQSSTFPGQFTPGRLLLSRQHTEQCVSFCDQYARDLVNSLSSSIPGVPRVSSNDRPHLRRESTDIAETGATSSELGDKSESAGQ